MATELPENRVVTVTGSGFISAGNAVLGLLYQSALFSRLGASQQLDLFYLCRTVPFYLEQLAYNYFVMIAFPLVVARRPQLLTSLRTAAGSWFTRVLVLAYAVYAATPLLFLALMQPKAGLPPDTAVTVARLTTVASVVIAVNSYLMLHLFSRKRYLCGQLGTPLSTITSWLLVSGLGSGVDAAGVAAALLGGACAQNAWLLGAGMLLQGPAPGAGSDARLPTAGSGYAVGMSAAAHFSVVGDRMFSAGLAEGTVSILKVGRQLVESLAGIVFAGLSLSSYTRQCEQADSEHGPDQRAVQDSLLAAALFAALFPAVFFLGRHAVAIVFGAHRFGPEDCRRLARCMVLLSPLLVLGPFGNLLVNRYYIRGQFHLPFLVVLASATAELAGKLAFSGYGLAGITWCSVAGRLLLVVGLVVFYPRRLALRFAGIALRTVLLVAPATAVGWAAARLLGSGWAGDAAGALSATVLVGLGAGILIPGGVHGIVRGIYREFR